MALAILSWEAAEVGHYRFKIDIGTSQFYKFNIGQSTGVKGNVNWVTEVAHTTPLKQRKNNFFVGDTSEEVLLPKSYFDEKNIYVQLISSKDERGKALAVSKVVKVPVSLKKINTANFGLSTIASIPMNNLNFNPSRKIQHRDLELSYQYSFEDLIGNLAKAVLPAAVGLLTQGQGAQATTSSGNNPLQSNNIAGLLATILKALVPAVSGMSIGQAMSYQQDVGPNRFSNGHLSQQMVFGIDDALLATLAGPIIKEGLQLLPQLVNATQQHRLQTLQANNQLMSGLAGEVQRRLMMQQLLQNQAPAQQGGTSSIDPAVLAQLLAQLQTQQVAAPATTPTATPTVVKAQSLTVPVACTLSNSVLLTFENLEMQRYMDKDMLVLQLSDVLTFNIKVNTSSTPKNPLPKAIYTFYFKDTLNKNIHVSKTFKMKGISAGTAVAFRFDKNELNRIPLYQPLDIFVEMRWQTSDKREFKAINSCNAVFVGNYFVQGQGAAVSQEKELNDMKVYRSFWNKIWASPITGKSKFSWELQIDLKYAMSLSPDHTSNGLSETKLSIEQKDKESLIDTTAGKMKAGIELSLSELNKLMDGWDGEKPLPNEKLSALKTLDFTKINAAELIHSIKLRGKSYEQGAIWIIPIFKLFEINLCQVDRLNEFGYVKDVTPNKSKFPLPVSARILGLKSNNN